MGENLILEGKVKGGIPFSDRNVDPCNVGGKTSPGKGEIFTLSLARIKFKSHVKNNFNFGRGWGRRSVFRVEKVVYILARSLPVP
jgi:hypothetical protein